jgi:hypothetical protein
MKRMRMQEQQISEALNPLSADWGLNKERINKLTKAYPHKKKYIREHQTEPVDLTYK